MEIGYARVSTGDQDTAAQVAALDAAGCKKIFTETASGAMTQRPELARMFEMLRPGDNVTVWKIDRLSRSLKDLLNILAKMAANEIGFKSLTETIDTTTPAGKMMLSMLGAFAEFERDMSRARTIAGMEHARKHGRKPGRPSKLTPEQLAEAKRIFTTSNRSLSSIARLFNVHPSTLCRKIELEGDCDNPDG